MLIHMINDTFLQNNTLATIKTKAPKAHCQLWLQKQKPKSWHLSFSKRDQLSAKDPLFFGTSIVFIVSASRDFCKQKGTAGKVMGKHQFCHNCTATFLQYLSTKKVGRQTKGKIELNQRRKTDKQISNCLAKSNTNIFCEQY